MSWTQTAATREVKDWQRAPELSPSQHKGVTAAVREAFEVGGIRTWTLCQLRDSISTSPGYPSLSLVNGALQSLVKQGHVTRVTAKAGGPGNQRNVAVATQYRRVIHATDETR